MIVVSNTSPLTNLAAINQFDLLRRPVIVFSPLEANTVFILPCATNLTALRFMHTLEIHPSTANGLSVTSVVLLFQRRAIDTKRLIRKTGVLKQDILSHINEMIRQMLTLESGI